MKNLQTDLIGYAKIALALGFVFMKLKAGQTLTDEDMMLVAALGLGAAGNKASADAATVKKLDQPQPPTPPAA